VADGAALEKRWAAMPRGFKSHPLRHTQVIDISNYLEAERKTLINRILQGQQLMRRGAGVAYQARLESVCRL
jgi:hypothetical protein